MIDYKPILGEQAAELEARQNWARFLFGMPLVFGGIVALAGFALAFS
jgi:hypothetical protein